MQSQLIPLLFVCVRRFHVLVSRRWVIPPFTNVGIFMHNYYPSPTFDMETGDDLGNYNNNSGAKSSTLTVKMPTLLHGYEMRELAERDFDRGFIDLLEQLTATNPVSRQQFADRLTQLREQNPPGYHIFVIEKLSTGRVVATATLVLEWKFIHSCGSRGRIEDVVVDASERGKQFGRILNKYLVSLAQHFGVYKLSLECTDELVSFYEEFGFRHDGNNFLVQRF